MTKKDMVKAIAEDLQISGLLTQAVVQKAFDAIVETLATEGRIELRDFGIFEVRQRQPRKARNPKTGTTVLVPSRIAVSFKAGKEMQNRVNQRPEPRSARASRKLKPLDLGIHPYEGVGPIRFGFSTTTNRQLP